MALSSTITLKFAGAAVQRGLASIKKGFANLANEGGKMFGSLIKGAMKWTSILGPLAIGAAFTKLASSASETASGFEQMRLKFTMFTGTMEGAVKLMDQIRKVDIVSNLDLETLGQGAAKLMAYGFSADEVADTLEKLSKVAGGNADAFGSLILAFGQASSKMILKGDDLKQFTEVGWNPVQQIMAKTGETYQQVMDRMEKRLITFDEVKQALADVTTGTGRFARAHELGSKTFLAATSRMQSQWALLKDAFGTPLNVHLGEIFDKITAKLPELTGQARSFGEEIGKVMNYGLNAVLNGNAIELLKSGFEAAFALAGKELLAVFIYGGTLFAKQIQESLKGMSFMGQKIEFTDTGAAGLMTWDAARVIAQSQVGSVDATREFQSNLEKNKDRLVPMASQAAPGSTAQLMKDAVDAMREMVKQQQLTNQRLQPTP